MKKPERKQKKKNKKPDDKEQSARFIETAERIGSVKNPEAAFELAVKKIVMGVPMKCDKCGRDNMSLKQCQECHMVFCWSCGLGNDYRLTPEPVQVQSICPKCGSANFIYLTKD